METIAHSQLKRMALRFLLEQGCAAAAQEVACPLAKFRADAAGWFDRCPLLQANVADERGVRAARTVIVECKQSRADFLKDSRETERLLRARDHLVREKEHLERAVLPQEEPQLRARGSALFVELEDWDFSASRNPSYLGVLRRLRKVERRLYGETKFSTLSRYRLADFLFLAAPEGMIRRRELPVGWGLLEATTDDLRDAERMPLLAGVLTLRVRASAPALGARPLRRQRLLRNIAVASVRAAHPELVGAMWRTSASGDSVPCGPPVVR